MIGIADVPTGIATLPGLTRWVILEDASEDSKTPPLVPIKLLKLFDAKIEPAQRKMTIRFGKTPVVAQLEDCDSNDVNKTEHQTTSLMSFDDQGWFMPNADLDPFRKKCDLKNPFDYVPGQPSGYTPEHPGLQLDELVAR